MTVLRTATLFTYFRGLPIFVVIVNCVIMVAVFRSKQTSLLHQNQRSLGSATTTLIALSVFFTVIEGYGFVFFVTDAVSGGLPVSPSTGFALSILDKYLLLINSMTNAVACVAFNQTLRDVAKRLLLSGKSANASQTLQTLHLKQLCR